MEISSDGRYFVHSFPDRERVDQRHLSPALSEASTRIRDSIVGHVNQAVRESVGNVYKGNLGILFALFHHRDPVWGDLLATVSTPDSDSGVTLLDSGILLSVLRGNIPEVMGYVNQAENLPSGDCEVLHGRAGCISALLTAGRYNPDLKLSAELTRLAVQIVRAGGSSNRLSWIWHGKEYLGAIHGVSGILHLLLNCPPDILNSTGPETISRIEATVRGVLQDHVLPGGNIKSAIGNNKDRLVHFCHGATGWVPLMCLMAERFQDSLYMSHAKEFGEVVWRRGLLATKGPGICHGISGSICALIDLYRVTSDDVWLRRAEWFGLFLAKNWESLSRKADSPYSLFEGIAGAYWALATLLREPKREKDRFASSFPGF